MNSNEKQNDQNHFHFLLQAGNSRLYKGWKMSEEERKEKRQKIKTLKLAIIYFCNQP
jgi:hypothetical protein